MTANHSTAKTIGFLGFIVMAVSGWNLSERLSGPGRNSNNPSLASRHSRPAETRGPATAAKEQMTVIRNAGDAAQRTLATVDLAEKLPLADFAAWLDGGWFDLRGGADLVLFNAILKERWEQEDPEGFALWTMNQDHHGAISLFTSWGVKQPQRVIDFFKQHPNPKIEFGALARIAKNHPDLALQRMQEMDVAKISLDDFYYARDLIRTLAEKSPVALAAILDSLKEPLKTPVENLLIAAKLKTDAAGELRKLFARPDGFEKFCNNPPAEAWEELLGELKNLPPEWRGPLAGNANSFIDETTAEKWWNADLAGAGFTADQEQDIRIVALRKMASKNPETALALMGQTTFTPREGDSRHGGPRLGIIAWALFGNPEKIEELIATLNSEDQLLARKALDQTTARNAEKAASLAAKPIETPEQWLEKIRTLSPKTRYEHSAILETWDAAKISALGEQFKSLPDDQKQQAAQVIIQASDASGQKLVFTGEALRYLITHPPAPISNHPSAATSGDPPFLFAAAKYVQNLAIQDPELAGEWIQTLPEGQTKLWARVNLHATWTDYDPKAADRWFKSLPAEERAEMAKISRKTPD